jgi:hypothetical protein
MTTEEFLASAIKALAKLPNNAARRAALDAKIEDCNLAHEAAQRRMASGAPPPKTDFFTISERIAGLEQLRARYQQEAA